MDITEVIKQATILVKAHVKFDKYVSNVWISPHPEEIRLVEVTTSTVYCGRVLPFRYAADPEFGIHLPSVLILLSPEEWKMVEEGKIHLPKDWDKTQLICVYDGEDPRKTGLKKGLHQLNVRQLKRVIDYHGEMVLDECNYLDGKFCPLAVALGLDKTMENPSHDKVFQTLTDLGYDVYNTRGIPGKFYTEHRKEDLLEAAKEVLEEKENEYR